MIDILLLILIVICAIAAIEMRDLLGAGVLLGAYSLLMAVVWTRMNAVDVAFTEASVGAGITTILLIATLSRTGRFAEKNPKRRYKQRIAFIVLLCSLVLVYGTLDMPKFGDPDAPANLHLVPRYIEQSKEESAVTNIVTAVLANYRGYDTLGETTVIFTAGTALIMLLRGNRKRKDRKREDDD